MKPTAPIRLHKPDPRSRIIYLASTVGAVVLVIVGWMLTVASAIRSQVETGVAAASESAEQARAQFREVQAGAQPVAEQVGSMRDQFSESMKTAEEIRASELFLLEHMKQQIEADKPDVYAKED